MKKCPKCDQPVSKYDLKNHLIDVHKEGIPCEKCHKKFRDHEKLDQHHARVHETGYQKKYKNIKKTAAKIWKCDICDDYLPTKGHLSKHKKTKHKSNYQCDRCPKIFQDLKSLENHITIIHEGVKKYQCDKCDKSFGAGSTLKSHIMIIHEGGKIEFTQRK